MKGFFLWLLAIPIFLHGENWQADIQKPFALSISIDTDQFVYLDLNAQYPPNYHLDMESLIDQLEWSANPLNPSINIYQKTITTKQKEGLIESHLHAVIQPLKQGPLSLTFLTISFEAIKKEEKPIEVSTPIFTVQAEPPKETIAAIAPLIPLEPEFPLGLTEANRQLLWENPERLKAEKEHLQQTISRHSFPWLSMALLLSLGGIGWMAYLLKDFMPKPKPKQIPSPPPKIKASNALEELQKKNLASQVHAAELSAIFLTFLEERLNTQLRGMTTSEIEQALKVLPTLAEKQRQYIFVLLKELDQIKFAKIIPSQEEAKQLEMDLQRLLDL